MNRIFALSFCLIFAVSVTFAQQHAPAKPENKETTKTETTKPDNTKSALPTVEQILAKFDEVTNSKALGSKIKSMVAKGTFEIPALGLKGTAEVYSKAPNKNLTVITIPDFGVIMEGFDGQTAWAQDPATGLRQKKGEELAVAKRSSDISRNLNLYYSKFELKGIEKVNDSDAYVIVATPKEGKTETWYFDVKSGLQVRSDMTSVSPQGEMPVQSFIDDYRDVEGVKMAFFTRQVTAAFTAHIKIEEVKINVAIDDAKFVMPKQ